MNEGRITKFSADELAVATSCGLTRVRLDGDEVMVWVERRGVRNYLKMGNGEPKVYKNVERARINIKKIRKDFNPTII